MSAGEIVFVGGATLVLIFAIVVLAEILESLRP